jgi:hypothetical protein
MHRGRHLLLAGSALAFGVAGGVRAEEKVAYTYDSLGRLTKVVRTRTGSDPIVSDYGYDAADNRTKVKVVAPPPPPSPSPPPPGAP